MSILKGNVWRARAGRGGAPGGEGEAKRARDVRNAAEVEIYGALATPARPRFSPFAYQAPESTETNAETRDAKTNSAGERKVSEKESANACKSWRGYILEHLDL